MYEDGEEESIEEKPEPVAWTWIGFFSILVSAAGAWFALCGAVCEQISNRMDVHELYKLDRKKFADQVRLELEAITEESSPKVESHSRR